MNDTGLIRTSFGCIPDSIVDMVCKDEKIDPNQVRIIEKSIKGTDENHGTLIETLIEGSLDFHDGVDAGMPAGTDSETLAYTTDDHHIRLLVKDGHFKDNMSQIFNMRSTLRHESYHDKGERDSKDSEVKTLMREINHSEFNKTTGSFQKTTLKSLQNNLIKLYEKSADSFNELINQAKEILEKHGMNGTPSYHDGGNSISF